MKTTFDGEPSFEHDPELPNGFQGGDLEQAAWETVGARIGALKRKGICSHGWLQGPPSRKDCLCLECGKTWPTTDEAHEEGRAILNDGA